MQHAHAARGPGHARSCALRAPAPLTLTAGHARHGISLTRESPRYVWAIVRYGDLAYTHR
eukprot:898523-Prymnesium_polylepis.1